MKTATKPLSVLMVCLGNICRSPTAESVLRHQVTQWGLQTQVLVDSAGTSNWHAGEAPDSRSINAAAKRGFDLSTLRSRQVVAQDFERHDYIFAMDQQNLRDLQTLSPPEHRHKLALLLTNGATGKREVPDPYDGAAAGFEEVLDLCEKACSSLLRELMSKHNLEGVRS